MTLPRPVRRSRLETSKRRQVTTPEPSDGEWHFAVSPDGETLAFNRFEHSDLAPAI
jgi:hypothetical protein